MNILLVFLMLIIIFVIVFYYEHKIRNISAMSKNKVHFYVARDKNNKLTLWLGKPFRGINYWINMNNSIILTKGKLNVYGLDVEDYNNLKWEDEPVEVFLNMED